MPELARFQSCCMAINFKTGQGAAFRLLQFVQMRDRNFWEFRHPEHRRTWLYRIEEVFCRFLPELKPCVACFKPYKVHNRKTWYSFKLSVNQYFVLVQFAFMESILQICHVLLAIGEMKRGLKSLDPF
ncbi:unnamed protein product [Larinioides sclopetarius]|uniref:Uncharacterized protein n=1 Tax=Larinioides sclopetarius TaxID=280406 RepID=A0AAV2A642_9ARAC